MRIEKNYPGLCQEKTPAGHIRWRVRVEGQKKKKITLPAGPKHPNFEVFYAAARTGKKIKSLPKGETAKGTLDELCERFIDWMKIQVKAKNLKPLTLSSRTTGLKQARECMSPNGKIRIGSMKVDLPREAFAHIRDSFGSRTGAAQTCLKALRAAYKWGEELKICASSPVFTVTSSHKEKGGATPWPDEDAEAFLAYHGPGTMARRWYFLAECTAGRIGDMHRLGPKNERIVEEQLYIHYQPSKRGSAEVTLPLPWNFVAEVLDVPHDARAYLLTEKGTPFASANSLDNTVRRWIIEAGLCVPFLDEDGVQKVDRRGKLQFQATRSQHGIRKRRAQKIAEASGSVYEVMAHLSHSDPKTAAIYTKRVERARLAAQAAKRVESHSGSVSVPQIVRRGAPEVQKVGDMGGEAS